MTPQMIQNFKNVYRIFKDKDNEGVEKRYFLEFLNDYVKAYKFEFPIH